MRIWGGEIESCLLDEFKPGDFELKGLVIDVGDVVRMPTESATTESKQLAVGDAKDAILHGKVILIKHRHDGSIVRAGQLVGGPCLWIESHQGECVLAPLDSFRGVRGVRGVLRVKQILAIGAPMEDGRPIEGEIAREKPVRIRSLLLLEVDHAQSELQLGLADFEEGGVLIGGRHMEHHGEAIFAVQQGARFLSVPRLELVALPVGARMPSAIEIDQLVAGEAEPRDLSQFGINLRQLPICVENSDPHPVLVPVLGLVVSGGEHRDAPILAGEGRAGHRIEVVVPAIARHGDSEDPAGIRPVCIGLPVVEQATLELREVEQAPAVVGIDHRHDPLCREGADDGQLDCSMGRRLLFFSGQRAGQQ